VKTVMVVEDYGPGRELYASALVAHGYRVIQACDGAEAVRLAIESPPDLVLMNVSVPLVSGVDATEILKAHPATGHNSDAVSHRPAVKCCAPRTGERK
jgi:two-component system, cell cycle response regulator DivK